MWLFPWASYLAVGAMVAVLVAMAVTPAHASELWVSVLSVAVALGAYYVLRHGKPATPR
jgi:L-asparagine transporter-like permease